MVFSSRAESRLVAYTGLRVVGRVHRKVGYGKKAEELTWRGPVYGGEFNF
ncbi:MAG: hypothetical protein ACFE8Z_10715 [Candidatus Hermodarchaeota archaeon]